MFPYLDYTKHKTDFMNIICDPNYDTISGYNKQSDIGEYPLRYEVDN